MGSNSENGLKATCAVSQASHPGTLIPITRTPRKRWLRPFATAGRMVLPCEELRSCVLANTRLAIVDLSERGSMPMPNEDSTVWITYNGECYNAGELRPQLISRGHQFRSTTDTEVILHLYEEYGDRCVEKLRGMFAFAIWDTRTEKLLLARDRLGIKPLYYSAAADRIIFASEIKALLASSLVPQQTGSGWNSCVFATWSHSRTMDRHSKRQTVAAGIHRYLAQRRMAYQMLLGSAFFNRRVRT